MSTELTISSFSKSLEELDKLDETVKKLLKTKHYQKLGEDGIYAILTQAKAMNFDPFEALNGSFYYYQGHVGMRAETMAYLVRREGHSISKDPKSNETICILNGRRKDNGDTWSVSFSMADAKRANLIKSGGPYEKYPSVMLYNRAMSILFRQLFPDLAKSAGYTHEEIREIAVNERIAPRTNDLDGILIEEKLQFDSITQEQADELRSIFTECPVDYLDSVFVGLEKLDHPVSRLEEIPAHLFDRIKSSALRNRIHLQQDSVNELNDKILGE